MVEQTSRHRQGNPTDLLWCKNVTSLTGGSNRPPLVQKRDVTNRGIQTTSFGSKKVTVTNTRGAETQNFPDSNFLRAKTFWTKCAKQGDADFWPLKKAVSRCFLD